MIASCNLISFKTANSVVFVDGVEVHPLLSYTHHLYIYSEFILTPTTHVNIDCQLMLQLQLEEINLCWNEVKLEVSIRALWWKMHNHTDVRGSWDVSIIPHQVSHQVWPSTESSISCKAIGSSDNQFWTDPSLKLFLDSAVTRTNWEMTPCPVPTYSIYLGLQ